MLSCVLTAESSSVPPDVTSTVPQDRNSIVDLPPNIAVKGMSRGLSRSSMMDTAGGMANITYLFSELNSKVVKFNSKQNIILKY